MQVLLIDTETLAEASCDVLEERDDTSDALGCALGDSTLGDGVCEGVPQDEGERDANERDGNPLTVREAEEEPLFDMIIDSVGAWDMGMKGSVIDGNGDCDARAVGSVKVAVGDVDGRPVACVRVTETVAEG